MAHSLSAKKRVRQSAKRRVINRARKSTVKTQMKKFDEALKSGDQAAVVEQYKLCSQRLDKVASTSTMHKKKASRLKSRMAIKLNKLNKSKA